MRINIPSLYTYASIRLGIRSLLLFWLNVCFHIIKPLALYLCAFASVWLCVTVCVFVRALLFINLLKRNIKQNRHNMNGACE